MNKLFYGVSTSQGDVDVKEVTIYNPLEEEMAPGDVLAVYFAHGNTVEAPSMVVSNTSDIAEETTDSTDEPIIDDSNDSNTDVDPAPLTEDEQTASPIIRGNTRNVEQINIFCMPQRTLSIWSCNCAMAGNDTALIVPSIASISIDGKFFPLLTRAKSEGVYTFPISRP